MTPSLVPQIAGPERVEINAEAGTYIAFAGTGFDIDAPHHAPDTDDWMRYAIAVQQLRDQKRYDEATAAQVHIRAFLRGGISLFGLRLEADGEMRVTEGGYIAPGGIGTAKDRTVIKAPTYTRRARA